MITSLRLQNFRSYKDSSFEFGEGVNIIVGPNASGKTNLLEGLLVVCGGKSYRGRDQELIKHKSKWLRLDGQAPHGPRIVIWRHEDDSVLKEYRVGGDRYKRLPTRRRLPVVVFEPNHLQLLTQSPELRRQFIDNILEQTDVNFGQKRRQYKRALIQRNSLLKQAAPDDQLFVWNLRLSELGSAIVIARQKFINDNLELLNKLYRKLSNQRHVTALRYDSRLNGEQTTSQLLKALEARVSTDRLLGFTSIGPHRDDIVPYLNNHALTEAASRGETRTMLLALKLLEIKSLEQALNTKPILLLDDVFSELDGARRRALTKHLQDHQTFITTTDADIVIKHFLNNCTVLPMKKGNK